KWGPDIAAGQPPIADPAAVAPPEPAVSGTADEPAESPSSDAEEDAPDAAREAHANALLARAPAAERRLHLDEVRKKLQALGEVNLSAIEEHEEQKERFRFLSDQKRDLESTLTSLRDAIARINRTSRRRFRETFEAVSKRFSENFPRLFRGGRASLALTDNEDVLEAGIEIMGSAPGQRAPKGNPAAGG